MSITAPSSRLRTSSVLGLLALLCTSLLLLSPVHAQQGDSSTLKPVRVQLKWAHQFQFAGFYAAIHEGYYQEKGLNVSLMEYSAGIMPIDQLMGGRADFAVADTGALIYRAAGVPLVALAAIFQQSPSILMVREDSGIQRLEDLQGRRAMLSGGFMNAELLAMLASAGVSSDDIIVLPSDTSVQALVDGRVDAYNGYTMNEPFQLNQLGMDHHNFHPGDYGVDFYGDILVTTETLLARDPQLVQDFREATLRGWHYALENPEQVVELILTHYNTQGKSREHLLFEAQEASKLILANLVPIGYMNPDRWEHIQDIFLQHGNLRSPVDISDFLYEADSNIRLAQLLQRNRTGLISGALLLLGMLLCFHVLRLRALVQTRTLQLQAAKQLAETEARTDTLTGLSNRRHFLEALTRYIAKSARSDSPLSIISIDIDHFKRINDEHGHGAGDEALQQVAQVLMRLSRTEDVVARIGGEEFALICLDTQADEALKLAQRLCLAIKSNPVQGRDYRIPLSFSAGVAWYERGDDVQSLLRKADLALYQAKEGGRDTVCLWEGETH